MNNKYNKAIRFLDILAFLYYRHCHLGVGGVGGGGQA